MLVFSGVAFLGHAFKVMYINSGTLIIHNGEDKL